MNENARSITERALADLRHDLRTPLNHIIGYGEMLMEDAEDSGDESSADSLRAMNEAARAMGLVIQNTLAPSKTHLTKPELEALRDNLGLPLEGIIGLTDRLRTRNGTATTAADLARIRDSAAGLLNSVRLLAQHPAAHLQTADAPASQIQREQVSGAILVVDDNSANRDILSRRSKAKATRVAQAENGVQALESVSRMAPDLVLLDLMMPEMDGYEVLRRMKSDVRLRHIPVIMMSALDELQSVVRCIEMGAEDYLPKPFEPVLLHVRVGACIEKKRLRDEEHRKTEELERTLQQLKEAQEHLIVQERLASLGAVSAGIAHEIKNPLNFITKFAEIASDLTQDIRAETEKPTGEMPELLDALDESVRKIREHGLRADKIVKAMLLHCRGGSQERQKVDVNGLLASDANLAYHGLKAQDTRFNCTFQSELDPAVGDVFVIPEHLSRVFLNIVNNACYAVNEKSRSAPAGYVPVVRLVTKDLGQSVQIRIHDNGTGMPADVRERIFQPFFTTKPAGAGTGIGLALAHEIVVKEHKGAIRVDSAPGQYTEFVIDLPR